MFSDNAGVSQEFVGIRADGIEVYETSKEVKKLPWKERKRRFAEIMNNQYRGRTAKFTRNGHTYYARFSQPDINKNIYGDNRSDDAGKDAKINVGADGLIFELVENAKYNHSEPERGKTTKAHKNVSYWDYFVKKVQIDGKVFDLVANVRKSQSGEFVYSLQLNEDKNTKAVPPENLRKTQALNGAQTAFMNSIRTNGENVNGKYSQWDSSEGLTREEAREQQKAYTKLKAENAKLRDKYEYWKGQTKKTKEKTVRKQDVEKLAKRLLKIYGSEGNRELIQARLQELGDKLVQGSGETLSYDELLGIAWEAAVEIAENAVAYEDSAEAYGNPEEIASLIRGAKFYASPELLRSLPEGFRKEPRMSDLEVLEKAANELPRDSMSEEEQKALDEFKRRRSYKTVKIACAASRGHRTDCQGNRLFQAPPPPGRISRFQHHWQADRCLS